MFNTLKAGDIEGQRFVKHLRKCIYKFPRNLKVRLVNSGKPYRILFSFLFSFFFGGGGDEGCFVLFCFVLFCFVLKNDNNMSCKFETINTKNRVKPV